MEYQNTGLRSQLQEEIQNYLTREVSISDNYTFSQYKLVKRISLFESRTFPTGKIDSQGCYKFFYDIIGPRIDNEVKNIDFDSKDITIYSPRKNDTLATIIANLKLDEYLRTTGQAEELNSAIEEGAGWGNIVWKKIKGGFERCDMRNFYVINQTAKSLNETPVIERHQFTQTDLRAKRGVWKFVDETIDGCKTGSYQGTVEATPNDTTVPYYAIYERNGEVCLKDLNDFNNKKSKDGDEDKYIWAKVIGVGSKGSAGGVEIQHILFAEELPNVTNSDIYKEFHRGAYKGRWWREGLYELLFDVQVRANQIGNQIAQGLEFASKIIFVTEDKLIIQNILTDLKNGDIIMARNLSHVSVRMDGFDQLANDWNRIIQLANSIANSQEVAFGETMPSGTPFRLGAMLNQNANKLYNFIREKLAIPLSQIFELWIVPELIKELKTKEILRLTGDSDLLERLYEMVARDWYINNLLAIGPHDNAIAEQLIADQITELKARPEFLMEGTKVLFDGYKANVSVNITGEATTTDVELQTLSTFIALEMDPLRRTFLIDEALRLSGLDVGKIPKPTPTQPTPPMVGQGGKAPLPAPTM